MFNILVSVEVWACSNWSQREFNTYRSQYFIFSVLPLWNTNTMLVSYKQGCHKTKQSRQTLKCLFVTSATLAWMCATSRLEVRWSRIKEHDGGAGGEKRRREPSARQMGPSAPDQERLAISWKLLWLLKTKQTELITQRGRHEQQALSQLGSYYSRANKAHTSSPLPMKCLLNRVWIISVSHVCVTEILERIWCCSLLLQTLSFCA